MLTRSDVALLDNAFSNLGDTFYRNRALKAQAQERALQQANLNAYRQNSLQDRQRQLTDEEMNRNIMAQLAQERITDSQQNQQAKATQTDNELTKKLKQNTIKFHQQQIDEIINHVNQGIVSPEQGTQMIKQGVSKWDDWEKTDNPMYAQYSAPDFALTGKPAKTVTTVKTGTEGGFPLDETNVVTTASSPTGGAPTPTAQARVKVKSPDGKLFTLTQSQLEDAKAQGYEEVQ